MLRLVIKGSKKAAGRAAARHGVPIRNCKRHPRFEEMICDAPCGKMGAVVHWYTEKWASHIKHGRGFEPGRLLFYSDKSCRLGGSSRLGRGRARR